MPLIKKGCFACSTTGFAQLKAIVATSTTTKGNHKFKIIAATSPSRLYKEKYKKFIKKLIQLLNFLLLI